MCMCCSRVWGGWSPSWLATSIVGIGKKPYNIPFAAYTVIYGVLYRLNVMMHDTRSAKYWQLLFC